MSDITLGDPAAGQFLKYDGSGWVPSGVDAFTTVYADAATMADNITISGSGALAAAGGGAHSILSALKNIRDSGGHGAIIAPTPAAPESPTSFGLSSISSSRWDLRLR